MGVTSRSPSVAMAAMHIWVNKVPDADVAPFTFGQVNDPIAVWSRTGAELLWASSRPEFGFYRKPFNGSGSAQMVWRAPVGTTSSLDNQPTDWSPDGTHLLFQSQGEEHRVGSLGTAVVRGSEGAGADSDAVQRRSWAVFSQWPMGRIRVRRIRSTGGLHSALPLNGSKMAGVSRRGHAASVASRRQGVVFSRARVGSHDGSGCRHRYRRLPVGQAASPVSTAPPRSLMRLNQARTTVSRQTDNDSWSIAC